MIDKRRGGTRTRRRALQTTAMMFAMMSGARAYADCTPEPTVADGTTTCSDTNNAGVLVATPGTTLTVAAGATVSNTGAAAIAVEVPNIVSPINETISIVGQVSGGAQSGIRLLTGAPAMYNGSLTQLALNVAAGGSVSGSTALTMAQTTGSSYGELLVSVDNAGGLAGSSGIALQGDVSTTTHGYTTAFAAFGTITNRAGATISGGIVGPVASLSNAGVIDGGDGSALSAGTAYPYTIQPGSWTNSGTIRSNSSTSTIVSSTIDTLTNSGSITNTGSGAALSSSAASIQNLAGGQIGSAGATAINGSFLNLVNAGTITGDVVTGNGNTLIDSSLGAINGSVTFGAGNDTLVVRYGGIPALITGISGTINAGGGINTELLGISADTTISTPLTLLTGFQQFGLSVDRGVTATLGVGFVAPGTIELSGAGTLVNRAAITTSDSAFAINGAAAPDITSFENEGSIQTNSTSAFAVVDNSGAFPLITNNGTIVSAGGGVSTFQGHVINTGMIVAAGTGVTTGDSALTNSGTIRSTVGIGATMSGDVGITSTNSGRIEGATIGVETSTYLSNSGTVVATRSDGVAMQLDDYGALLNQAGGIVGNGGRAVTANAFDVSVINSGVINGSVSLTGGFSAGADRYISLPGGVLNGNLTLDSSGVLFTDWLNTGTGQFAGINGTVIAASGAMLRYRVSGAESAIIGPAGPFANPSFELTSGASLSLTAPGTVTQQLLLAGTGTVDIDANVSTTADAAISSTSILSDYAEYGSPSGALAITSHGTVAVSRPLGATTSAIGVSLSSADTFTNLGTITVTDPNSGIAAYGVSGGSLVNNGSILLSGGAAAIGSNVVNNGSITQVDGGMTATGIAASFGSNTTLDNRGTISVGGMDVTVSNGSQITNSGMIVSTGTIAIAGTDTSGTAIITNSAGGTIAGTGGTAVRLYGGSFTNAGTVNGTVDMGYGFPYYSDAPARSFASGTYIAAGGTIAGDLQFGDGADIFLQTGASTGVSGIIDGGGGTDVFGYALSSSASVTLTRPDLHNFEDALVQASGSGTVVTTTATDTFAGNLYAIGDGAIVNQASITGALMASVAPYGFAPQGTVMPQLASLTNAGNVAGGVTGSVAQFVNTGSVGSTTLRGTAVSLYGATTLSLSNSGTITSVPDGQQFPPAAVSMSAQSLAIENSGQIMGGLAGNAGGSAAGAATVTLTNSGTIGSAGTASSTPGSYVPNIAVTINGDTDSAITVTNTVTGTISATGTDGTALLVNSSGGGFALTNAGAIVGGVGASAGAIIVSGASSTIANSGTITGSILLDDGEDSITNSGLIDGSVSMGGGDDRFTELAVGRVTGVVDGGDGINALFVDTSGSSGGAFVASHFTNFQSIAFTGTGTVSLSGPLAVPTVQLAGGTVDIAAGTTLTTTSATTITGSDGADNVVNNGTIAGAVSLGAGDDNFTEGPGSRVAGGVDGGAGFDTYHVVLAGNRTGIGPRTNFEALSVEGSGTLGLTLDQDFSTILQSGTGLSLALAGHSVGGIMGSDGNESLSLDGDVTQVSLGGGNDALTLSGASFAGRYDGGLGADSARFTAAAPTTLSGSVTGFETISFATGALTLSGTLGDTDSAITFDDTGHQLNVTSTGVLSGTVSLGNGSNLFRLAAGGILNGTVAGGTGFDEADLDLAGDRTLAGSTLQGFELLTTSGSGNLIIGSGDATFARMALSGGLTVAAGASLAAGQVQLGTGADDFTIAGGFGGSADGGAGHNRLLVSGGSAAAPVAFADITDFDTLVQSDGFVTLAGTAQVGGVTMTGGRFVGLAGSMLVAPQVGVGAGATFGSAGTVVGNLTVAGTLSPGASPGTMTVQGNVGLQPGSHTAIEVTTGVSDLLHATGMLTIASGATLDLTGARPLTPGAALDLVIADGGITGSFTTINRPSTIFGFIRQTANSIELFGQFANTGFRPQVTTTIDYVNGLLTTGKASPGLLAAVPTLVDGSGATNGAAFARLNPEPYASAMQIGIENGLSLAKAARSGVATTPRETPALFAFAQGLGDWRTLDGAALGTSQAKLQSHGELGGVGYGSARASLAAFVGYLKTNERIDALGAHTDASDTVAGVIGHLGLGNFDLSALLAYDGGRADLRRALPGTATAASDFRLRSWVGDLQVGYAFRLGKNWALKPQAGLTYVGEHRGAANESGSSAFDLAVAADRQHAAFVDGTLALEGGLDADAKIHPWLSGGVRRQLSGERTTASASFVGAATDFSVVGAGRSRTLATAVAGLSVDLSHNVSLFASYNGEFGKNGDGEGANGGLKMRF